MFFFLVDKMIVTEKSATLMSVNLLTINNKNKKPDRKKHNTPNEKMTALLTEIQTEV